MRPHFIHATAVHPPFLFAALIVLNAGLSAAPASAQNESKLLPPVANLYEHFGAAISLDGDRLLIGAANNDLKARDAGIAYFFERQTDGSWLETTTLSATDGGQLDHFGSAVSLDGDRALVGAIFDVVNGYQSGSAYILERQPDGTWRDMVKLAPIDGSIVQSFGSSVALDGDRALIAADFTNLDNGLLERAGAAYVFDRQNDGSWVQTAMLTANEPEAWDFFGRSVALQGDRALIGVAGDRTDAGPSHGSAYLFERQPGGSWAVAAYFTPGSPVPATNFGASVALDADRVLIGSNSPESVLYERQANGSWEEVAVLVSDPSPPFLSYAFAVSLHGDRALVGAVQDEEQDLNIRRVTLFERQPDGSWPPVVRFAASDGHSHDDYGRPVAIEGDLAVIAAPTRDEVARGAGAVYVYDLASRSRMASFTLIDAETELPVPGFEAITADTTLNLNLLPTYLNVRANPAGNVESVRFSWTSPDTSHTENRAPYALFGDLKGNYTRSRIEAGRHTLLATPFGLNDAAGRAGDTLGVTLNFVRGNDGLLITKVTLVDVATSEDLYPYPVSDGDVFDYGSMTTSNISLRADVVGPVESVRFTIPELGYDRLEETAPYTLFGDIDGRYLSGNEPRNDGSFFLIGPFTLSVTAYSGAHGEGDAGTPYIAHLVGTATGETGRIGKDTDLSLPVDRAASLPEHPVLESAYPNPFNPSTTIRFGLPEATTVRLLVYDLLGREVERLIDATLEAGWHETVFEAGDRPSGIYLIRFEASSASFTRRILLVK